MTEKLPNLTIVNHPLIQTKLTVMRNKNADNLTFRNLLNEIAGLMVYEICRDFSTVPTDIETPMEKMTSHKLEREITLVPVLRAGLGMTEGILQLVPNARVGHIGLYRNEETLEPVAYYNKFPTNLPETEIIVIDPMLATGGSASAAIQFVKEKGGESIRFVCLVAAPEGVKRLSSDFPEVPIFTAALDRELNQNGYIMPGLGDAGDRIFGTE